MAEAPGQPTPTSPLHPFKQRLGIGTPCLPHNSETPASQFDRFGHPLKNHWFQNLSGCSDCHREGCTLGIACRPPYKDSATPNNVECFPCIECKRNRSLVHIKNLILVSCWFRNLRTHDIHNKIQCICNHFLRRALRFVSPKAKDKTLCTNKPAG